MAIADNDLYKSYCSYLVRDVLIDNLKKLITIFIDYAAVNLGAKAEKADVDRIIEFVSGREFNFLPVSVIASGFMRGSLGKLKNDKTSLNPRNIHEWLAEVSLEYRNTLDHDRREERLSQNFTPADLKRFPLGQAICWKTDHLTEEEWDKAPLMVVADMIGKGIRPTKEYFGIKD